MRSRIRNLLLALAILVPVIASTAAPSYAKTRVWGFDLQEAKITRAEQGLSETCIETYAGSSWNVSEGCPPVPRGAGSLPPRDHVKSAVPLKSHFLSEDEMEKWSRYLGRRGVTMVRGGQKSFNLLREYRAAGLYLPETKEIILRARPPRSAFYEEVIHALQDQSALPRRMELNGLTIDRYEFEAMAFLVRYRHRLGIPNIQVKGIIENLREVIRGEY